MDHYHSDANGESSLGGELLRTRELIGLAVMYLRHKGLTPEHKVKKFWQVQQFKKEWDTKDPQVIWYKIYYINTYRDKTGKKVVLKYVHQATAEELHTFQKEYKRRERKPRINIKELMKKSRKDNYGNPLW